LSGKNVLFFNFFNIEGRRNLGILGLECLHNLESDFLYCSNIKSDNEYVVLLLLICVLGGFLLT